jgi:hypothetical protein
MKKIFLILLLILTVKIGYSQIPYYDALKLSKLLDKTLHFPLSKKDSVYTILNKYLGGAITTPGSFDDSTKNPFIYIYFNKAQTFGNDFTDKGMFTLASTAGNLDVTNFADGMAKFIVARTKLELSTAFFERFKTDLDGIKQIQILFPASYDALKAIDKEIYNYSAYLDLLRESFQEDLTFLIPDIEKLVKDESMDIVFTKYPEIRIILSDALFIVKEFREGKHPGEIIHNYLTVKASKTLLDKIEPSLYPSLRILDLFSQSLRSKQSGKYWISPDSIKLLFANKITIDLYLGLIYQKAFQSQTEKVFGETKFVTILKDFQVNKDSYQEYFTSLISECKNADYFFNVIKENRAARNDKPTFQDYFSLYDATLNIFESLSQIPFPASNKCIDSSLVSYFSAARSLGNIYVDIYEKRYTSAVVEFSSIYNKLLNTKVQKEINGIKTQIHAIKDKDTIKKLTTCIDKLEMVQKASSLLLKYGTFAATIAKAENSDEVQAAIEAVALPAGSARIKRESIFNVSFNAYCGLFGGMEKIKGVDNGYNINSFGVAAPIGISISKGKGCWFPVLGAFNSKHHWSQSIFLSVVDIGALTAFRFTDTTTASAPNIQLKDIISPGIFYSLGIPKSPISLNIGYQIGPLLRKVAQTENKYSDKYSRISISLCVDIPILNFYNSAK